MKENIFENKIEENNRTSISSSLENAQGINENFSIKLEKDGKPKLVVFEDIDKTLLHLEPTYNEIRKNMWPEAVERDGIEEFSKVHLDGFRLGTMWRELYRIYGIYNLGKEEWKNPDIYIKEFLSEGKEGENIDNPGDKYHEISDELLRKFDDIAAETVEKQAKENPDFFNEAKIEPTYKLNSLYKRLGIVVVGMSANPRKFIDAICKYTELSENFIDCATDTDVPGTKEYKMQWLINRLEKKGLSIPYDRLLVIGDSPLGDVGSASRFQKLVKNEHPEVSASGIVIIESDNDMKVAIEKLKDINDINIHTFDYTKVPVSEKNGKPELFSKNRKDFYKEII
ncbi:HAD family hydrolase [Candidatus Nomurabacteria bacterium]|nr:HAD family hydrolase [Candidatus Nomurabacteria bacterium]